MMLFVPFKELNLFIYFFFCFILSYSLFLKAIDQPIIWVTIKKRYFLVIKLNAYTQSKFNSCTDS